MYIIGTNIDKILLHLYCNGKEEYLVRTIRILEEKGKLWIGDTKCTKQFAERYSKQMVSSARKISTKLCKKYGCKSKMEDIASEALVYILERCGDIEKNYNDNEEYCKDFIIGRIHNFIRLSCFNNLKIKEYKTLLHRRFTDHKGNEKEINVFDMGIEDKDQESIEDEVERDILRKTRENNKKNPEETCVELLRRYIEIGYTREEALSRAGKILKIQPEEMLTLLKKYMIKNKKVRETKDGGYVLGE